MTMSCPAGRVAAALMLYGTLAVTGCTGVHKDAAGHLPEKRNPAMNDALYSAVAELAALDLGQHDALQAQLAVSLQAHDSGQGWQLHQASGGQLGPVALEQVELRSPPAGQTGSPILLLRLAQPQPMQPAQWPGAVPSAPRPDAPDAPAWWELRLARSTVMLGLDGSGQQIVSVSVRQSP